MFNFQGRTYGGWGERCGKLSVRYSIFIKQTNTKKRHIFSLITSTFRNLVPRSFWKCLLIAPSATKKIRKKNELLCSSAGINDCYTNDWLDIPPHTVAKPDSSSSYILDTCVVYTRCSEFHSQQIEYTLYSSTSLLPLYFCFYFYFYFFAHIFFSSLWVYWFLCSTANIIIIVEAVWSTALDYK